MSKTGGAGTCGSIVNNTFTIDYTPGGGTPTCQFTYDAESGDIAGPSQATVIVNQPPAFGQASYNASDANVGVAYSTTVAQDATDPESDTITYSRNGGI